MNQTEFAVSRFENRNGVASWRVAGLLHGVRIRKNFKTKEEAAAEKAMLEIGALQATAGMRAATTFLSDAKLREAEDAFRRLDARPRSLLFYLDYAYPKFVSSRNAFVGLQSFAQIRRGFSALHLRFRAGGWADADRDGPAIARSPARVWRPRAGAARCARRRVAPAGARRRF